MRASVLFQVCHVGADASGEPCGARRGQGLEPVLYGVDAPDEFGGVRHGDDPFDLLAFAGQDEFRPPRPDPSGLATVCWTIL